MKMMGRRSKRKRMPTQLDGHFSRFIQNNTNSHHHKISFELLFSFNNDNFFSLLSVKVSNII